MPAASKQQQKLMGIVRAIQKGKIKPSDTSKKAQQMAKSMEPSDVKKFAATKHKGLPKVKKLKKEGIHDMDITSASHTNVKTPEGGNYDPKKRADNLKKLKGFGPKGKKEEGALEQVFAVQKPYSGCQLTSLIRPIDPLKGLEGSEVMPDSVHGVYHDQDQAQAVAQKLYEEYMDHKKMVEEKKGKVVEKIKKVMNSLEKKRKDHTDMIKENPKEASQHKQTVAELSHKLDELITTLERIEMSKENLEETNQGKFASLEDFKKNVQRFKSGDIEKSQLITSYNKLSAKDQDKAKNTYANDDDVPLPKPKNESINETLKNPKANTADDLAELVLQWYDWNPSYIDDGAQYEEALSTNKSIVQWFYKHSKKLRIAAYKIIKNKKQNNDLVSLFGKNIAEKNKEDLKEAIKKLFEKKKEFTFKKIGKKSEEGTVKADTLEKAKKEAYEKGGDPNTVEEKKEKPELNVRESIGDKFLKFAKSKANSIKESLSIEFDLRKAKYDLKTLNKSKADSPKLKADLEKEIAELERKLGLKEDHTANPNDKYKVVYKGMGFYDVYEGDVLVAKDFLSKEEAQAYANKKNKENTSSNF